MNVYLRRKLIRAGSRLSIYQTIQRRKYPWRKNRTPYRIFLAEMLLVRTKTDAVARIYENVFNQFPTIYELANASEDQLLKSLYSLGMPKRIPYMISAARYICDNCNGKIPKDVSTLLRVPGVGIYTASAIAVFAYRQEIIPSDVNILRFIARLTGLEMENKTKGTKELRSLAQYLSTKYTNLPIEKLLDFSILVCKPQIPKCEQCVLTRQCKYFQTIKR